MKQKPKEVTEEMLRLVMGHLGSRRTEKKRAAAQVNARKAGKARLEKRKEGNGGPR